MSRLTTDGRIDEGALYVLRTSEDAAGCAWVAFGPTMVRLGAGRAVAWWRVPEAFGARAQDGRFDARVGGYVWPLTNEERAAVEVAAEVTYAEVPF